MQSGVEGANHVVFAEQTGENVFDLPLICPRLLEILDKSVSALKEIFREVGVRHQQ